ncbi:hypothetical protein [Candidatus Phytoplasma fabacearum]|uniref:hypothetical protein n=1 Tax=Candidatus Phytoplasma fabacearum TaxID=2982628 RepID=UPI002712C3B4|nr:hypothetical protein ['Bituminaria bituminosa' little leaf phytoplasma]MDO8030795.1 hypothetical protein ['Bituminaria bituminosa' little leaf phytoplasma]
MMKVLFFIFSLLFVAYATENLNRNGPKRHFCGKVKVDNIIKLICRAPVQKRNQISSFRHSIQDNQDDRYVLWKNIFNINDNSTRE